MDAKDFKAQLDKAREFTVNGGEACFYLRLPTELQMRRLIRKVGINADGIPDSIELQAAIVPASLVGWKVPAKLISDQFPDMDLPFDPELIEHVFDRYPQDYDRIFTELIQRYGQRKETRDAELGNS